MTNIGRKREREDDFVRPLPLEKEVDPKFIVRPLPLEGESPRKRRRREIRKKCLTFMGEMVIPPNPTQAMRHVYISTVRLWRINELSKGDAYVEYFSKTLQKEYLPLLFHILNKILRATKSIEKRKKIVVHFKDLVMFLQGRGRQVTPRSVYYAKERLARLFTWYYKREALSKNKKESKGESKSDNSVSDNKVIEK
jgi:hypothetical protein